MAEMTIEGHVGLNRAMRRGTHMAKRHITKKRSRGTMLSGSWRGGAFGSGPKPLTSSIED